MEKAITIDKLITPGTYISRLLSYETLGFFQRFIVNTTTCLAFTSLRQSNLEQLKKYGKFCDSDSFPQDREGWRILREMYNKVYSNP